MARKKIVILGGGMGGLSSAYWLTNRPNWQDDYEITLYQLGWRLGGKGASSRNSEIFQRIEDHGFHFFPSFYENTFAMMRQCYTELGRGKDEPLAEFIAETQADEKRYPERYAMHRGGLGQMLIRMNMLPIALDLYKFSMYMPTNSALPGSGKLRPSVWQYLQMGLEWLWSTYQQSEYWTPQEADQTSRAEILRDEIKLVAAILAIAAEPLFMQPRLQLAKIAAARLPKDPSAYGDPRYTVVCQFIVGCLKAHVEKLWEKISKVEQDGQMSLRAFSAWTLNDFFCTTLSGILEDELLVKGFDAVNHEDFRDWLKRHAIVPKGMVYTLQTSMVNFVYDAGFSRRTINGKYVDGIEAGTAIRIGMRMFVDYMGSVFWMFQAGCGEAIFAPLYQVLKRRGVQFKFFHKALKLHLDPKDQDHIQSICMQEQVHLTVGDYDPLILVKGLPCWPDHPRYEQIQEGRELRAKYIDLESTWADWSGVRNFKLEQGRDFDEVVLAIPLGAQSDLCQELIAQHTSWQKMINKVKTTRTQAMQLYTNKTQKELGWNLGKPLVELDSQPVSTWADMTQQLVRENWLADSKPKTINYFVGAMSDDPAGDPPPPDPQYQYQQNQFVKLHMIAFLKRYWRYFWPNARITNKYGSYTEFDWGVLFAPKDVDGERRVNCQYYAANIEPSARYVMSLPGTSKYRLPADNSGFSNLYLAGDWVKTGLNYGCMEAATMSGAQVSRAISAQPLYIPGESDFETVPDLPSVEVEILINMLNSGVDFYGGLAEAIASALLAFRKQISPERLANVKLQVAIVRAIFEGSRHFVGALSEPLSLLRQDFQGLLPYRDRIDYERLARRVVEELVRQQTSGK